MNGESKDVVRSLQIGRGEEGEDDARSACPLIPWATHVIQWSLQSAAIPQGGANH